MAKYRKKPVVIEAITFDEFIEYGKTAEGAHIVNGMPWSFKYNGHPVTNENDACYLVPTHQGFVSFTPDDMLITQIDGEIYPCKRDIFEATYELVNDIEESGWHVLVAGAKVIQATYPKGSIGYRNFQKLFDRFDSGDRSEILMQELESIE